METALKKYFLLAVLLLCSIQMFGQGKLYTRKIKLQDFPASTLKVVTGSGSFLEMSVKEEVAARWRISPYEFCTPEEYQKLHTDNSLYFLRLVQEDGIAFLQLSKGGRDDDEDNLKKPFDIVKVPIASVDSPSGKELLMMGAFVDILQNFVEDATASDRVAYAGLGGCETKKLTGKRVYVNTDSVDSLYEAAKPNALLGISISPAEITFRSYCYKMLISADTHELFYYKKTRYKGPSDAMFSESEIRQFDRRNGIIAR